MTQIDGMAMAPQAVRLKVRPGEPSDFELWRWSISPVFEIEAPAGEAVSGFWLESDAYRFDGFTISHTRTAPMTVSRSEDMIVRGRGDDFLCIRYRAGVSRFTAGGIEGVARAGDVALFDLMRPFRIVGEEQEFVSMNLRRAEISPLIDAALSLHGLVLREGEPLTQIFRAHVDAIVEAAPQLHGEFADAARTGLAALIAACFKPAARQRETAIGPARAAFERVRAEIVARLADSTLDASHLSARCNVSRTTLYRMFEPHGGVALFIRRQRMAHAHRRLTRMEGDEIRIADLAAECGFEDSTTFGRRFREAFGVTPREFREAARKGAPPPGANWLEMHQAFEDLNRWLQF